MDDLSNFFKKPSAKCKTLFAANQKPDSQSALAITEQQAVSFSLHCGAGRPSLFVP